MKEKNILSKVLYENNMTYRELSKRSGVSVSTLNCIANFVTDPRQSTMVAIARALNMKVTEIFNLDWKN